MSGGRLSSVGASSAQASARVVLPAGALCELANEIEPKAEGGVGSNAEVDGAELDCC